MLDKILGHKRIRIQFCRTTEVYGKWVLVVYYGNHTPGEVYMSEVFETIEDARAQATVFVKKGLPAQAWLMTQEEAFFGCGDKLVFLYCH